MVDHSRGSQEQDRAIALDIAREALWPWKPEDVAYGLDFVIDEFEYRVRLEVPLANTTYFGTLRLSESEVRNLDFCYDCSARDILEAKQDALMRLIRFAPRVVTPEENIILGDT